jgi:hypothetical protein
MICQDETEDRTVCTGPNRTPGVWDRTTTWKEKLADQWMWIPCLIGAGLAVLLAPQFLRLIHWLGTKS